MHWLKPIFAVLITSLIFSSCVDEGDQKQIGTDDKDKQENLDKSQMLKVGNQIFSIPSPIQSAKLFKELDLPYINDGLHTSDKLENYSTSAQKALNLGVYGADLGYVSLYEQDKDARNLLGAVNRLCTDLDLIGAIDDLLAERFLNNIGNADSLVYIISDFYKVGDQYLKENDRGDIAALVLAGGWIEGLYLTTTQADDNEKVQLRIAEQKTVIGNLIKILEQSPKNAVSDDLVKDLIGLENAFQDIDYEYVYMRPETDVANKKTKIRCKTDITMSKEVLNNIKNITSSLRNKIIEQ